jgi:hypothetical protein
VRHPDTSEANPGTNISTSSKCPASVKANRTDLAPIYSQNSSRFSTWHRWRAAHPSILCPGHFIAVEKYSSVPASLAAPRCRNNATDMAGTASKREIRTVARKGMGPLFLYTPRSTNPEFRPALLLLIVCYLHSKPDLGLRNCRDVLGRSGLKESKQETGMATEFQTRSRRGPVLRHRTPKLSLEPQEIFHAQKPPPRLTWRNFVRLASKATISVSE